MSDSSDKEEKPMQMWAEWVCIKYAIWFQANLLPFTFRKVKYFYYPAEKLEGEFDYYTGEEIFNYYVSERLYDKNFDDVIC